MAVRAIRGATQLEEDVRDHMLERVAEMVTDVMEANGLEVDEIAASVGADSLGYISLDGMIESTGQQRSALCTACFTGEYPVELPDESLLGKHLLEATLSSPTMGRALPVLNNP